MTVAVLHRRCLSRLLTVITIILRNRSRRDRVDKAGSVSTSMHLLNIVFSPLAFRRGNNMNVIIDPKLLDSLVFYELLRIGLLGRLGS